jgi:hypothetical protein
MIRSFRANNGSFANLGSISLQPVVSSLFAQATLQGQTTHPASSVLPTYQQSLSHPIMFPEGGNLTRFASPSLFEIGQHFVSGRNIIIPLPTRFNTVMPTYH